MQALEYIFLKPKVVTLGPECKSCQSSEFCPF